MKAVGFEGEYSVCTYTVKLPCATLNILQFDTSKADGQFRKPASNKKLLNLIGGFEFTPFNAALDETVAWFLQNYNTKARVGKPPA